MKRDNRPHLFYSCLEKLVPKQIKYHGDLFHRRQESVIVSAENVLQQEFNMFLHLIPSV